MLGGIANLKKPNMGMCKQCWIGKMIKRSFRSHPYNSDEVLELIHTYLCASIGIEIYYGDMYFILFFDDYSRMFPIMFKYFYSQNHRMCTCEDWWVCSKKLRIE